MMNIEILRWVLKYILNIFSALNEQNPAVTHLRYLYQILNLL